MHGISILGDFVVILSVALVVAWLSTKLKLPTIVGFLAAGVLLGPGAMGVVANEGEIAVLAEVGVVLLLFSIGLELSLDELNRLGRFVFGAGSLQLLSTAIVIAVPAYLYGFDLGKAIFFGFLGGLSSTAIVLTSLRETDEIASVHGRGMLGVLLFQDLAVVPLILLVPLFAGNGSNLAPVLWTLLQAAAMVLGVWLVATFIFPWVAERVVRTRRRELFTLFTAVVAIGTAYVSGIAGLSLALGAFLGGLVISESPYSGQMMAEVEPFKDVFNSLFFVSMGLMVEPGLFVEFPAVIFGLSFGIIVAKALVLGAIVAAFGHGFRVAVLVGLGVSQLGEFSFILAKEGLGAGLMSNSQYGIFLAAAVLTMTATPLFLRYSSSLAEWLAGTKIESWFHGTGSGVPVSDEDETTTKNNHVVIVGYGHNGRNIAASLRRFEIDYTIVDLNPQTVRKLRDDEPIHYGDATREPILRHLGVEQARALIVTIADRKTAPRIVDVARHLNSELYIVVRARFENDVKELYRSGADQVIVEEYETALEFVGQALEAYDVHPGKILREKDALRRQGYGAINMPSTGPEEPQARHTLKTLASNFHTEFVRIPRGGEAAGQTIGEMRVRNETGASVMAVARNNQIFDHPDPEFEFEEWDQVLLVGEPSELDEARALLSRLTDG